MPMDHEDCLIETFTASDGYVLHYRHYLPATRQRGQIVAIHGIQSHGGWYSASCQYLARVGWEIFFLDRRGSGLNELHRGDTPSYRRLLADLDEFLSAHCPKPPFLLAISWGGKLAVALEHLLPGSTAGLLLLTPGFCPRVRPSLWERLAIAGSWLFAPTTRFTLPLDEPGLFTLNPPWMEFIRNDPLGLRKATARFLVESRRLDRLMLKAHRTIRVPVLLLLAGRDRIIQNEPTREFVELFPTYDCRILEYPEASHTLEFEPDPLPIFRDIERWLETHCVLV